MCSEINFYNAINCFIVISREKVTNKCTRLGEENEDQREQLAEAAQREESYKQQVRTLEKTRSALEKRVEELEKEVSYTILINLYIASISSMF